MPHIARRLLLFTALVASSAPLSAQSPPSPNRLRIVVIEGEDAINVVQQRTATAPVVEVRDRNNQPVAGVVVRFAIRNGKATFNGARALSITTNSVGRAAATGLTPTGSGALQITAQAAFQGQTAVASIAQVNVMTAVEAAAATSAGASGASAGAAGAGGSSGGVSTTTLGVIGGAAAGGTIIAVKELKDDTTNATVSGSFSGPLVVTFVTTATGAACARTYSVIGTLTLDLTVQSDGAVSGSGRALYSLAVTSDACTGTPAPSNQDSGAAPITGTRSSISFQQKTSEIAGVTATDPGARIERAYAFSGSMASDGTVNGSFTYAPSYFSNANLFTATGSATFSLSLR